MTMKLAASMWLRLATAGLIASMTWILLPEAGVAQEVPDPDDACHLEDNPPAPFTDRDEIPEVHRAQVDCAYNAGVTEGAVDESYGPALNVRRDQMASFIARALEGADMPLIDGPEEPFNDIDGNEHADAINALAASDIVHGTTPTTFEPAKLVRRDQIASFLLRAVSYGRDVNIVEFQEENGPFTDVPDSNVHSINIFGAAELGLVQGRTATTYDPNAPTRRDQMASLLMRTIDYLVTEEGGEPTPSPSPTPSASPSPTAR